MNTAPDTFARQTIVLDRVREDRVKRRADWIRKIAELAKRLPPLVGVSPADDGTGRVFWTDKELEELLEGVAKLKEKTEDFIDWAGDSLSYTAKSGAAALVIQATVDAIMPAHRHRKITGLSQIFTERERFYKIFGLAPLTDEPAPEAEKKPVEPAQMQWTKAEELKLITHISYLMRKQGMRQIPSANDPLTREMFAGIVRTAQDNALPRHRHKVMINPKQVLENSFLMPHLEPMLRMPQLPKLPDKDLELEEIMAQKPSVPQTNGNGNGHHDRDFTQAALATGGRFQAAPGLSLSAPEQIQAVASLSDAEIFREAAGRFAAAAGQIEALAGQVREVRAMNDELLNENKAITERQANTSARLQQVENQLRSLSTEAERHKVPRVGILGCRKDEFDEIVRLWEPYGFKINFRHYDQQTSKDQDVFDDFAICMPGLSHNQTIKVQKIVPNGQWTMLNKFSTTRALTQLKMWFTPHLLSEV